MLYLAVVALTMFVLPLVSIGWAYSDGSADLLRLTGVYFVFGGVGVRLTPAGVRQYFQPDFTAREILGVEAPQALLFVRELGGANIAAGIVRPGLVWRSDFRDARRARPPLSSILSQRANILNPPIAGATRTSRYGATCSSRSFWRFTSSAQRCAARSEGARSGCGDSQSQYRLRVADFRFFDVKKPGVEVLSDHIRHMRTNGSRNSGIRNEASASIGGQGRFFALSASGGIGVYHHHSAWQTGGNSYRFRNGRGLARLSPCERSQVPQGIDLAARQPARRAWNEVGEFRLAQPASPLGHSGAIGCG